MADIQVKDIDRIAKALEAEEGWRLARKSDRVLWAYPPDKTAGPIRVVTCTGKPVRSIYVALRRWGIDLEPARASGRKASKIPCKPAIAPAPARALVPAKVIERAAPAIPEHLPDDIHEWRLSDHAIERAEQRHVKVTEILAAVASPDIVEKTRGGNTERRTAGDVIVVVDTKNKTVITTADVNDARQARNGGTGLVQSRIVRERPLSQPAEPPQPPEPSPQDGVLAIKVSDSAIRSMTARVKASSARGTKFGTWTPPSKPSTEQPSQMALPLSWTMTPAVALWLTDVVLKRLRSRPGDWASILHLPSGQTAAALGQALKARLPEMEFAVRDTAIFARWNGAAT